MKTNYFLISLLLLSVFVISSCSKDDNSEYPKTVNIKFEITTSSNPYATVTTTINNTSEIEEIENFPFSRAYTQQEVNVGTYLKLTFEDGDNPCQDGDDCSYAAELVILVDEEIVKKESFDDVTVAFIDYTFTE